MTLFLLLGSFVVLLVLGAPVGLAFLSAAFAYLWMSDTPLSVGGQILVTGVNNFTLLAVPLYILTGELMNSGGITDRIFRFASAAVGHIRGGMGHVNVLGSMIFAGISGSSSADAAGLGRVEIKAMIEEGYRPGFAASITAASSTIGPIIPPSIHLVIYGAIAEVGVDYLFLGGIVPGLVMGLCLMGVIYILAVTGRERCPVQPWPGFVEVARRFRDAFLPLTAPIVIVGGILSGVFTPTEAGVTAVAYVLLLGLILGELKGPEIWQAMQRTVRSSGVVLLVLATAQAFAWGLTIEQLPATITNGMLSLTDNAALLILIILCALLILGLFESASANLVIVTPILVPLAPILGLDPVHLGVVIVLALMIGVVTPPVGMSLFIVSEITKLPIHKIVRDLWPYVLALMLALLLVTFLPDLVLFLPRLYGYTPMNGEGL